MRQRSNVFDVPGDYAPVAPPMPMPEFSQADITQAEPPSPYEHLTPFHVSLANSAAQQATQTSSLNNVMMQAWEGVTPREQAAMREKESVMVRTQALLQGTKSLPADKFDALMAKLEGLGSQLGGMVAPKREEMPVNPISALATGAAMLIDPSNAGQYSGAFTNDRNAREDTKYKEQTDEFKQAQERLKLQYGVAEDQIGLQERQDDNLRREANDALNRELKVLEMQGKSADEQLEAIQKMRQKAEDAYRIARTVGGKQRAAEVLKSLGVPIPQDELDAELGTVRAEASRQAKAQWGATLNRMRDDFMEIPEEAVASLTAQRSQLARDYGIPETDLEPIITRKTAQATKFDENKRQFEARFSWMKEKDRQTLAMAQTRISQGWERIQIMRQAFENRQMETYYRMQRGMFSDQMEVLKFGQDAAKILGGNVKPGDLSFEGQAALSALKEIEKKIAAHQAKIVGNPNPGDVRTLIDERVALEAQKAQLLSMYEEAVAVAKEVAASAGQAMPGVPDVPVAPTQSGVGTDPVLPLPMPDGSRLPLTGGIGGPGVGKPRRNPLTPKTDTKKPAPAKGKEVASGSTGGATYKVREKPKQ